jgi:hypothetical protein
MQSKTDNHHCLYTSWSSACGAVVFDDAFCAEIVVVEEINNKQDTSDKNKEEEKLIFLNIFIIKFK